MTGSCAPPRLKFWMLSKKTDMSRVIGIDLGTTFSCVAHLSPEGPKVIPNLEGMATTPSMVCFTSAGEILVGNLAARQALANPEKTIFAIKRLIGNKYTPAVQEARPRLTYNGARLPTATS